MRNKFAILSDAQKKKKKNTPPEINILLQSGPWGRDPVQGSRSGYVRVRVILNVLNLVLM